MAEAGQVTVDAKRHIETKEVPQRKVDTLIQEWNISYDFSHPRRGVAVVINMRYFDIKRTRQKERTGTDVDAQAIVDRLMNLGFDVRRYDDLEYKSMEKLMKNLAKENHTDADCFVCVILSHGKEGLVYAYDRTVDIENDVLSNFMGDVCPTLAGKPKLFFIQACRGEKLMEGVEVTDGDVVVDAAPEEKRCIPKGADFLIAYSTVPGYYSWRNTGNGSWFIQALCHAIDKIGTTVELMQMMTYVNRIVAYYFQSDTADKSSSKMKQMPSIETRLTKFVYFHPKKDASSSFEHNHSKVSPRP